MMNRICVSPILLLIVLTVSLNAQPKAGDWKVPTRFGQFVFTVSPTGTQINKLATTCSNYSFGGITQNGTVTSLPSPGWPISNGQFASTTSINPNGTIKLTLNGTFTPSGDQASGTWSMLVSGQTDSDVWGPVTFTPGATAPWSRTDGPNGGQVYTIAVSGTSLFAGTDGGGAYLSTNDGTSWTQVNTGLTNTHVHALAVSGTNLFAGTSGGVFLSTNNGTSWTAANTGLANTYVSSLAVSGMTLFAATNGGVFLSTDNGTSWTAVNNGLTNTRVAALAVSGANLFAATQTGGVFLSTNNGTSWTQTGVTNTVLTSFAVSGTNLFAGTIVGVFLSTNNGTSWTAVNTGLTDASVWSLAVSGATLFAGTMYTGVWRRPLAEMVTLVERVSTDVPTSCCLHQNYPNPFNPSTKIQFSIPSSSFVSLKVFNVLGAEIVTLVDENKPPGTCQVTWDAKGYPSGVYFYRLMSAGKVFTGKMNLLK